MYSTIEIMKCDNCGKIIMRIDDPNKDEANYFAVHIYNEYIEEPDDIDGLTIDDYDFCTKECATSFLCDYTDDFTKIIIDKAKIRSNEL